jgi:hypothetical protein
MIQLKNITDIIGDYEIIAGNEIGWGKGSSIWESTKNCKKATGKFPEEFFLVPAGTEIEDGIVIFPSNATWRAQAL